MRLVLLYFTLTAGAVTGCTTSEQPTRSEMQADVRAIPPLSIEETIRGMVHVSKDWEMPKFRIYRQRDLDDDGIDDTILIAGFEHGNYYWEELFVCLSSAPTKVMHMRVGGRSDRLPEELNMKEKQIIIKGKQWIAGDAGCCPSQPYESIFAVVDGKIVQKQ